MRPRRSPCSTTGAAAATTPSASAGCPRCSTQPADLADANGIAEVVRRCPTGALHYRLWAGDPEEPARPTTITRDPAGPLLVRGDLYLDTPDGTLDETRAALCGCGQTSTQPFCDGACGVNQQHPGGTRDPAPASGNEP